MSDVFAHHRAVFAFHQSVVGGAIGPDLVNCSTSNLFQLHLVVEKLRAVVGVEAADAEGELMQRASKTGNKWASDGFATAHDLPLRHGVDSIDVIKTLAVGAVALVHAVDPHEARLPARINVHPRGAGLGVMDALFAIGPGAPQVVDVGGRDRGQAFVFGQAVDFVFAL